MDHTTTMTIHMEEHGLVTVRVAPRGYVPGINHEPLKMTDRQVEVARRAAQTILGTDQLLERDPHPDDARPCMAFRSTIPGLGWRRSPTST